MFANPDCSQDTDPIIPDGAIRCVALGYKASSMLLFKIKILTTSQVLA